VETPEHDALNTKRPLLKLFNFTHRRAMRSDFVQHMPVLRNRHGSVPDAILLEPTEDMALRKEDKTWLQRKFHAAIQEHFKPHGWRKL
jgi:hypothetical protein